ncbi:GDSL-like Lipase/Acylhydrolase [compost metagenome]
MLPQSQLVLCEPFILRTGATDEKWSLWTDLLTRYQSTVRELAKEFDAIFVPLQDVFDAAAERMEPAYWLWDGVHPTAAGHDLIAERWLEVVQGNEALK